MPDEYDILLLRAPSPGWTHAAQEMIEGFKPEDYPGDGLYFATHEPVALDFQGCYGNGMQVMFISKSVFDKLVEQRVVQPDGYYPKGQSWCVTQEGLAVFNKALLRGGPNSYHPE